MKYAVPTAAQQLWQDHEILMFIHFLAETYRAADEPRGTVVPVDRICPTHLDTDQWVDVALAMGAKMIVMVAKHVEGFCWWQTETSPYGVKELAWRNSKGDLVAELAATCQRRGVRLGIYLQAGDDVHKAGISGTCATPEAQSCYNAVYRQQLTELLSRYGEIGEIWFDGSVIIDVGDILKRYAPEAMIFQGPHATIRWVGNENGFAPYPAWNSVRAEIARTGMATAANGSPQGDTWLPLEVDTGMSTAGENGSSSWCWRPNPARHVLKRMDRLMETYYRSVGHGATLLLNNTPDPTGLIPEADARRCTEFGAEIDRRFGQSLGTSAGQGECIELVLPKITSVDHVVTMEVIAFGERIRRYVIEGAGRDRAWRVLAEGTAIGHKKIDFFKPARVRVIRLRVLESSGLPLVRRLAAFNVGSTPAFKHETEIYVANSLGRVGKWLVEDGGAWQTVEWDIASHVTDARQYLAEFIPDKPDIRADLEIQSVCLLLNGIEVGAQFVTPTDHPHQFNLNITAAQSPYGLRAVMRCKCPGKIRGEFIIHRQ